VAKNSLEPRLAVRYTDTEPDCLGRFGLRGVSDMSYCVKNWCGKVRACHVGGAGPLRGRFIFLRRASNFVSGGTRGNCASSRYSGGTRPEGNVDRSPVSAAAYICACVSAI